MFKRKCARSYLSPKSIFPIFAEKLDCDKTLDFELALREPIRLQPE